MLSIATDIVPSLSRLRLGSLNIRHGGVAGIPLRLGAADNVELGAQWTETRDTYLKEIWLPLKRKGTIAADKVVKVRIESDAAGLPSGTSLGTSSAVLAAGISADRFTWVRFAFPVHLQLAGDTVYHVVLEGDYTASADNHILWLTKTVASGGNQEIKDGSWANVPTESFPLYAQEHDLAALDPAEPAIYTPGGGSAVEIPVVFDREFSQSQALGDMILQNRNPTATCREENVSAADRSATLKVRRLNFKVVSVEPDGNGITVLQLTAA